MNSIQESGEKTSLKKQEEIAINQSQKQEETTLQKIGAGLRKLFVGDPRLHISINAAIVASTYFQCLQLLNMILLFTYFQQTNSNTYSIIITTFTVAFFLIDIIPKISHKYYIVFNLVSVTTGVFVVAFICVFKIIADNLINVQKICSQFQEYFTQAETNILGRDSLTVALMNKSKTLQMCDTISLKFWLEIGIECVFIMGKIVQFFIYIFAYRISKQRHEFLQRKRRRKERYNFMVRQKVLWDQNRKV